MAKKNNVVADDENESFLPEPKRKKSKKGLFIFLALFVVVLALGFVFRKQVRSFASKHLSGVPVIGSLLKDTEDETVSLSKDELQIQLAQSKAEAENLKQNITTLQAEKEELEAKVASLQQYETRYQDFLQQKEEWDESVAATNTDLFISQFEKVYPDVAERIYSELKGQSVMNAEQKAYAKAIGEMDADQAAKALEILIPTDPELIQMIFGGMSQEKESLILSSMTSEGAAQVIKLISPDINADNN